MHEKKFTIFGSHATKSAVERAAEIIFTACGLLAVVAVFSITLYMIISGTPALFKVGVPEILFGTVWKPTGNPAFFGILYVILTSIVGTFLAILICVPIGLFTAIFLAEVAPPKVAAVVRPAVELLAGIPSVIYGLLGILILNPLMYKLEMKIFAGSTTHQFTGGANLISAVLVLAIMILPTVINISEASLRAVPKHLKSASLIAIASPIARPQPKTTAVMMPECAAGTITLKIVWICVAPSASDALFKCFRLRTCDRGGNGDQPGIWKFSQSAASI